MASGEKSKDAAPRPGGPGGTRGHALARRPPQGGRASGTIDTVVTAFTDMQGRLFGKRIQVEYFLDEVVEHGVEGCNYLLALDMEMEPAPRLRDGQLGGAATATSGSCPTWRRCAGSRGSTAPRWCSATSSTTTARPVVASPRQVLIAAVRARRARWATRRMFASELEFYLYKESYAEAHEKDYSGPHADDPLHPRLPHPRHHDGRAVPRADPPRDARRRASRSSSRRARPGTASTRSTPATPTPSPPPTATRSTRTASRRSRS